MDSLNPAQIEGIGVLKNWTVNETIAIPSRKNKKVFSVLIDLNSLKTLGNKGWKKQIEYKIALKIIR